MPDAPQPGEGNRNVAHMAPEEAPVREVLEEARVPEALEATRVPEALEELLDSLLYEGYALYPYTPGATKNATPTPFGILYPPTYASASASTFHHLELRCALRASPAAELSAEVRFLAAAGERHEAAPRRVWLAAATVHALAGPSTQDAFAGPSTQDTLAGPSTVCARPVAREVEVADGSGGRLLVALSLDARQRSAGDYEVALRVENRTPCVPELDRAEALRHSLLSTHPLICVRGGRFVSPLERPCESVNTFPVLASDADDVVLGAAIVLPDHPQIAPESRGGLYDSTEIEEALLLHVQALSDAERAEIERHDPAVREMVARAAAATPADILALHGGLTLRDPGCEAVRLRDPGGGAVRSPVTTAPPEEPPDLADPRAGEEQVEVAGVHFRRGAKVRIRPGPDADLHARMLAGRTATIERILIDYDGRPHLGLTIDDDPGQELLRDSGRFLFFFAPEVEVLR